METVRIVVYDGAADRYITLHFDPLCLVPLCCIVCAWNDERTLYNLNGDLCLDELDVSWREGYFELCGNFGMDFVSWNW